MLKNAYRSPGVQFLRCNERTRSMSIHQLDIDGGFCVGFCQNTERKEWALLPTTISRTEKGNTPRYYDRDNEHQIGYSRNRYENVKLFRKIQPQIQSEVILHK